MPGKPAAATAATDLYPNVSARYPARHPARLAAGSDLPGPAEVGVVVDLDPVDNPDRRHTDLPAPVGELLVAVLVVQAGIAPPGGLQRVRERAGGAGLDQGGADVLAVRGRGVHLLGDPRQQPRPSSTTFISSSA